MDDGSLISAIIILAILLFFAAYFAVCETSFASVSRIKLRTALDRGNGKAKKALYVADNFDKAITTCLIGTNIVHLAAASYVTVLVTRAWGVGAVSVSTLITTIVVFFVGEMLPKSIAKKYSERFSLGTAASLCFFMRIFSPLSAVLTAIGGAAAKLTRGDPEVTVTEDELYDIIETMTDEGELDSEQGELVHSALTFGELTVESILTARVDMAAIDVKSSSAEIIAFIKAQRHSRFPVYEGSIDNVIGVLQIRKYIKAYLADGENTDLRSLLDEAYFVHRSTNIDELLPVMSSKKLNMAVVTDNYGGVLGIVTVEDILEELVGDIWDEDDVVVESCVKNADGSCTFAADLDIEDAFAFMGYEDPDEFDFEHKLLGEWAYEQFDFIPGEGDSFSYNGLKVTVEKVARRRIMLLRVETETVSAPEGGEEA
ncbi:MAG: hemolysin family protein [Oscillospiraceae bacterium]